MLHACACACVQCKYWIGHCIICHLAIATPDRPKPSCAGLQERSELEQLNAETSRKGTELERLRQSVERERGEVDVLTSEKQNLEERIAALSRERGMLEDGCRSMDDKLNTMKR